MSVESRQSVVPAPPDAFSVYCEVLGDPQNGVRRASQLCVSVIAVDAGCCDRRVQGTVERQRVWRAQVRFLLQQISRKRRKQSVQTKVRARTHARTHVHTQAHTHTHTHTHTVKHTAVSFTRSRQNLTERTEADPAFRPHVAAPVEPLVVVDLLLLVLRQVLKFWSSCKTKISEIICVVCNLAFRPTEKCVHDQTNESLE